MFQVSQIVTIKKYKYGKRDPFSYEGTVIELFSDGVVVDAIFTLDDIRVGDLLIQKGDRFIETYYPKRWYNILQIHQGMDGEVKGWYCNISQPAIFIPGEISFIDLALDVLVFPDQTRTILDEDEFNQLTLPEDLSQPAIFALNELLQKEFFVK